MRFAYGAITLFGGPFQGPSATHRFSYSPGQAQMSPHNPASISTDGLGYFPFRSPLLRESLLISLPGGTEMFHFPPFAPQGYAFTLE